MIPVTRGRSMALRVLGVMSVGLIGLAMFVPVTAADKDKPGEKAKPEAKAEGKADAKPEAKAAESAPIKLPEKIYSTGYTGSFEDLIGFINTQIRDGWTANEVMPSDPADDGEWLRRVHLDIVGHVPDLEVTEAFLADKDKAKRSKMIETLLEDPSYVRNFTTIWTNLLIGRGMPRDIDRPALEKFLRESFAKNRPWSDIVTDLLTAEGDNTKNGAANFLLSHLNDGAVPATAMSAKLFLGQQVQCTQCHNHPFNEWKQDQFWEFNSFFKQVRSERIQKYDEKTGRMVTDHLELTPMNAEEGVFFETRNALMKVAYPRYNGVDVDPGQSTNRRKELAKLVTQGEEPQLALSIVNRMWAHFLGYGFTKPVDDMGPHNAPSHPEVIARMARELVKNNYDLKNVIRWICNSEAYNLSSRFNSKNQKDNPAAGEPQLFSHVYMKSMTAEQLYDSLIIATNAHKAGSGNWEAAERQRRQWLGQFILAFGTDENDDASTFDGTIPQALMMMNGELMQKALSAGNGTHLASIINGKGNEGVKIRTLYMATLARNPTPGEVAKAKKVLSGAKNALEAYQDLYWALLNCNEFIFNY